MTPKQYWIQSTDIQKGRFRQGNDQIIFKTLRTMTLIHHNFQLCMIFSSFSVIGRSYTYVLQNTYAAHILELLASISNLWKTLSFLQAKLSNLQPDLGIIWCEHIFTRVLSRIKRLVIVSWMCCNHFNTTFELKSRYWVIWLHIHHQFVWWKPLLLVVAAEDVPFLWACSSCGESESSLQLRISFST